MRRTNWAGNHTYLAGKLLEPGSMDELQEHVRMGRRLRALGSRHSFNDIADTDGDQISLRRMARVFELDTAAGRLTVDGGVRYGEVCSALDTAGYALNNLASLPHICVAGACATATHGSGDRIGNLATAVAAMEVVTADGELVTFSRERDHDLFDGAVVALGGLGVITSLTLDLQPAYQMRQDIYENLPMQRVADDFDEITSSADSVSLFTSWRTSVFEQVWLKRRVRAGADRFEPSPDFFGATIATVPVHPIPGMSASACTEQLGVAGPWHERLPHFRMDHMPSSGDELQSEYLLPRRNAIDALGAILAIRERVAPVLRISEVRTIAADQLWMSTAFGRPSVAFHFTWRRDWESVRPVLLMLERALAPFEPRPHWGKLFTMPPGVIRASYPRLPEFAALLHRHDPSGTFRNAFLDRVIAGA